MPEAQTQSIGKGFRRELRDAWRRLPDKPFFFGLLAAWLALFHFLGNPNFGYVDTPSLFGWMWNAYTTPNSDDSHGTLIPIVVVGLFWWRRKELLAVRWQLWWPGLGLVAVALLLHLTGYIVQQQRLSIVALFTGIYGLMGLVWGREWLQRSFFPFVLLLFCIPVGSLAESVTFPLRMLVTKISVAISQQVLGVDVIRSGSQILDPHQKFLYDVAPACSGIHSLIALTALTTIYGCVEFRATWKRLLMVAVAIPLAVLGNVVRITLVIIAGEAFGQEAGTNVHDRGGFLPFVVAIVCVMILGYWLRGDRESMATRTS